MTIWILGGDPAITLGADLGAVLLIAAVVCLAGGPRSWFGRLFLVANLVLAGLDSTLKLPAAFAQTNLAQVLYHLGFVLAGLASVLAWPSLQHRPQPCSVPQDG